MQQNILNSTFFACYCSVWVACLDSWRLKARTSKFHTRVHSYDREQEAVQWKFRPLQLWRTGIEVSVTHRLGLFKPITWSADSRTTDSIPSLYIRIVEISVPFLCYESMHVRKLEVQGSRNVDIYMNYSFWLGWSWVRLYRYKLKSFSA